MKTIVRGGSTVKMVGEQSSIVYVYHDYSVGDTVEIVDRNGEELNIAKVVAVDENNVVLEMTA